MIVKVQLSLNTTAAKRQAMIYNESRTVEWSGDASDDLIELMGDSNKAFFHAKLRPDGTLEINGRARDRSW